MKHLFVYRNSRYLWIIESAHVSLRSQLKNLNKPVRGLQRTHEPDGLLSFMAGRDLIRQRSYPKRLLGDVTKSQLQPKGKKHVTTEADSPGVSFQTIERGVCYRTFETGLIQSSRKKGRSEDKSALLILNKNLNQ